MFEITNMVRDTFSTIYYSCRTWINQKYVYKKKDEVEGLIKDKHLCLREEIKSIYVTMRCDSTTQHTRQDETRQDRMECP